jgi:tetratricopeptide (TPR) repeat protein
VSEADSARSEQDILQALTLLREEPYGAARSARTEELVDEAERAESDRALVIGLFELLTAYEYGAETHKAPVLFSRILKLYADRPKAFDDWAEHRLFWCFKWITTSLLEIPEVPLATIEGWIAQMEERYRAAGKPLQAVRTSRYKLAAHLGVGEQQAYELWATRPRDEFSDCEACEARYRGEHWARQGEDARALKEWAPVLEGRLTCAEEPAATIARALVPLVRAGRADEAVSLHRSGYRATKGRVSMDAEVARHLQFLALTGNSARGLELLAENRYRFDSTATALTRLSFLLGVRVLLTRLVAEGNGQAPVSGPNGRALTAAQLLAEVAAETEELAERFDARNGTKQHREMLDAWCAMPPLTAQPLELGLRAAPLPVAPPPPAPVAAVPEDFAALLAEARHALAVGRPDQSRLWQAVAERANEEDLDELLRAELADREAFELMPKKRWSEAERLLRQAADLFEGAGQPGRAVARRSRAEWCAFRCASGPAEPSWEGLDALAARAEELLAAGTIDAEDYCIVLHSRTSCAWSALRPPASADQTDETGETGETDAPELEDETGDEERDRYPDADPRARERFDRELARFHEAAIRLGVTHRAAVARGMASRAAESDGRIEEALALAEEGVALAERCERPWMMPEFLVQSGHLLNRLKRLDEAAEHLHRALALATEWPFPEANVGGLLMELAWNRLNSGDAAAAVVHLTAAASRFDRQRQPRSAVVARCMLGDALVSRGRLADAIAVYESVLDEEAEARLSQEQRGQLRLDLGRALMRVGEHREAAEVFVRLAEFVEDWPEPAVRTMVVCELARALFAAGMLDQARTAADRARQAHEQAPNPGALCAMLRVAANGVMEAEGGEAAEQALAYLDEADAVTGATPERPGGFLRWPETAQTADARTQILGALGRNEEALAATVAASLAWERGGSRTIDEWAESVRIAAVLEGGRLGRREQALARIAPAIERCRLANRDRAVKILTQLAENLGRS